MATKPRFALPITLVGEAPRVLIVGGGAVGTRKAATLVDAGCAVTVIAREASPKLTDMDTAGRITLHLREYRPGDGDGFDLVVTATGNRALAESIALDVRARGGLVNCADAPELGNVHLPATLREGSLTVAVSTGGASPGLAARVRDFLRAGISPRLASVFRRDADDSERGTGTVFLVGAGPGDPDLITLAATAALAQADVILYDMLVNPELLRFARRDAIREFVGKTAGGEYTPQAEINQRLYAHAVAGRTVVRLKGGDPFLFGRGSEEWRFLAERGVRVECVSGVSSAFAAITAAGYPLTERERCDSVFVTTGHRSVSPGTRLVPDYDPGVVAIVLMASKSLAEVLAAFREHGWSDATPTVMISRATLPDQRHVASTLGDIADASRAAQLATPALLAVGDALDAPIVNPRP
ncbi:MAG: uroporphyrinogen-III C-methyltransferase [Deltaproteobacteria bacterium]|nr:uroporphyrinogen-III C-methyltransferase [Deltaproteobacteria bacterium]